MPRIFAARLLRPYACWSSASADVLLFHVFERQQAFDTRARTHFRQMRGQVRREHFVARGDQHGAFDDVAQLRVHCREKS